VRIPAGYASGRLSEVRVNEIEPGSDPRWDEFVAGEEAGHVYQHSGWLRCLAAEYDRPLIGLCTEDGAGSLTGILPLVATRGIPLLRGHPVLGARLSSLPRTPVAGPLARDSGTAAALLAAALERARDQEGARLQIKRAAADLDGLVDGLGGAAWRSSYVVTLPDDPGGLRFGNSRNHGRIKWAVNKAAKEGVEVRVAENLSDVQAWYPLYLRTMREVVVPPRPLRLFEAMWRELAPHDLMRLYVAEQRGTMIAGSIVLGLGRTAFYAFNGRLRSALPLRPNEVLQWEAIHDACKRGFERYDLGEVVAGGEGLADFKRKWGADEVQLHRYYHPPPEPDGDDDGGGGGLAKRATAMWPRLPLGVTRLAGDVAYRWL
jgi:CelD/BcsL family acetyltransferase involved in cellulose biosynthesis